MAQEDKFIVPQRKPAVGKSTVVSVRLPDTMLAKLEDAASKTGVPAMSLCRCASTMRWPGWRLPKNKKQAVALELRATAWFLFVIRTL